MLSTTAMRAIAVALAVLLAGCSSSESEPSCVGKSSDALKICATTGTEFGIDVSKWQKSIDWKRVKNAGVAFGFARVSDGLRYPDAYFATNALRMREEGIVRGAYQYFRASQDPVAQAQFMLDSLRDAQWTERDMPPVIDVETLDHESPEVLRDGVRMWLSIIESTVGKKPIFYTAMFMSDAIGTEFSSYPLWVANYRTACPSVPPGWTDWRIWQNADNGLVDGIDGPVDINLFQGTLSELTSGVVPRTKEALAELAPVAPRTLDLASCP